MVDINTSLRHGAESFVGPEHGDDWVRFWQSKDSRMLMVCQEIEGRFPSLDVWIYQGPSSWQLNHWL